MFILLDTLVVNFSKYQDISPILAAWLLVHYLTHIGTKNSRKLECLAKIVKENDAWSYFNKSLNTCLLYTSFLYVYYVIGNKKIVSIEIFYFNL